MRCFARGGGVRSSRRFWRDVRGLASGGGASDSAEASSILSCVVGQANQVLLDDRLRHNERFAVPAADAQSAWRKAPSDHTRLLELCALQYVRKVSKSKTVRIDGRILDIPASKGSAPRTYAGKTVIVRRQKSDRQRADDECDDFDEGPHSYRADEDRASSIVLDRSERRSRLRVGPCILGRALRAARACGSGEGAPRA